MYTNFVRFVLFLLFTFLCLLIFVLLLLLDSLLEDKEIEYWRHIKKNISIK